VRRAEGGISREREIAMNLEKELAELQDALSTTDFYAAMRNMKNEEGRTYLLVKVLQPIRIKIDGNKNHRRPHVHIDYGRQFHAASYAINTGQRIVGESKYDHEVVEWIDKNRPKLLQAWELVQSGKDATPIACELRGE
jgi:methionine synthase II (cobalamin-independent)